MTMGCLKHRCSSTHTCMYKPVGCEWDKCEMIFAYEPQSEFIDFEISYQLAPGDTARNRYIAIGFSDTQDMLHRTLNIVAIFLIAVGFILIFIAEDGRWAGDEFPQGTHSILGMTASIGIFLQPIVAYFRCAPHDSKRVIFNWGHGLLGYLSWCCAAASIYMITYPPFSYNFKVTDQFGAAPLALMIILCVSFVLAILLLDGCRIGANILKRRKSAYQTNRLMKASANGALAIFQLSAQFFSARQSSNKSRRAITKADSPARLYSLNRSKNFTPNIRSTPSARSPSNQKGVYMSGRNAVLFKSIF
ncbi:Cytochrom B561 domain containing protein [Trichuris trichiura]|uniref:Cytochrom B561 domain containing protein n=1 Tax=Trichuris trichiura TaxID=36087 RepID=A0A077ZDK6_TRITR|nr:Cytochrom B561 domain containing protein [Trichuris trichiura]